MQLNQELLWKGSQISQESLAIYARTEFTHCNSSPAAEEYSQIIINPEKRCGYILRYSAQAARTDD